jgi:two-component system, OmpR family, response regulator QseB
MPTIQGSQHAPIRRYPTPMRLLLIEDDAMIGESLRLGLRQEGHTVNWVREGKAAEHALSLEAYELVLLDLGLPYKSGLEVLKTLRQKGNPVPVIIVTARDEIDHRIEGLDAGADDYVTKPFDLDELAARIRALQRRRGGRADPLVTLGNLILDPAAHRVTLGGRDLALSHREFALLHALAERPGTVLSRAQIEERLYGWGEEIESNAVEVHIHNLRKKMGSDWIRNLRGVGYFVSAPQ